MNAGWQTWLQVYLVYGVINFLLGVGAVLTTDFGENLNVNAKNWAGYVHSLLVADDYQHWSMEEQSIPALGASSLNLPIIWAYPASIANEQWVQSCGEKIQHEAGRVIPLLLSEEGWQEKLATYGRYLLIGYEISPNESGSCENKLLISAPREIWSKLMGEILSRIPFELVNFSLKPISYLGQPGIEIFWSGNDEITPLIELCLTAFKTLLKERTAAL